MSITLNAHQLGRLLDRTADHIGDEYLPVLHGIRLEADTAFLYAIATDRYTLAVARYRHHGLNSAPFARTIPARTLPALRRWLTDQPGSAPVTLTLTDGRIRFTAPHSEMSLAVDDSQQFIGWRGLLRDVIAKTKDGDETAFPALATRLLARFATADEHLRVRTAPGCEAVLLVGEDFLGAQKPVRSRHEGFDTGLADSLEDVNALWDVSLTDPDGLTAVMPTGRPRYDASRTPTDTVEALLRQTMSSTRDLIEENGSPRAVHAHAAAGVMAWSAYRYLKALQQADPKLAARIITEVADELDDGALGEFAWDAAAEAGFDPQKWQDELEAATPAASGTAG
ncbi:hypothetical protein [Streptomyces sp. CC210A]|uniref:DNA polymerase III subunit beta family protein n=1 Tax=Streptomyces sp. CC210A TaxID=2898184 RepID=UPI001F204E89|nr:hypothetical protein [Streptomyces sp. CC210A]